MGEQTEGMAGPELADRFEAQRPRLRAVAYRTLGSFSEAEDAVQEAWIRLSRTDVSEVENLAGWLTTVVARVCLNMLRSREQRREDPLDLRIPDPVISPESGVDPEHEALLTDAVGLALLVVLDSLKPAERLAFVLHDMFAVPFEEIAPLIDKTPAATRQLASRARRRVREGAPSPDPDLARQREVVDAFFAAARDGRLDTLVSVLHPEVVLRADGAAGRHRRPVTFTGAALVSSQAVTFGSLSPYARPALINGTPGAVVISPAGPLSVMSFTVHAGLITHITVLTDPARLAALDLSAFAP
ncbi:RNA polymerase sigma 70 [Kitasatospora sp. MMS16-BH015]|uniref:sigma-70 family RNA polymerase sigma factor n=1 Tax=Kitasatospora sp. MMS16-BH015 TaxID=2018025 RepID=UPI000CA2DD20|nr:sigma-70 family RNA polymerase sigma factor [Kitasatospora sp. MMS16-BH015]AUG78293.1 RNA polymerase sigma 70 [Kitasatospora sp. MMS16-BH015]